MYSGGGGGGDDDDDDEDEKLRIGEDIKLDFEDLNDLNKPLFVNTSPLLDDIIELV